MKKYDNTLIQKIKKINHRKMAIIIVVSAALLFIIVVSSVKFYFSIGHDLSITIAPTYESLHLYNNQSKTVAFTISKDQTICKTRCEYSIIDTENGAMIINQSTIINDKEFKINYSFLSPVKGSGQKVYQVNFICQNLKSTICQTNGNNVYANALVTVNYELSPEMKNSSMDSREMLSAALINFSAQDILYQRNIITLSSIKTSVKSDNLISAQESVDKEYHRINITLSQDKKLWDAEEYDNILKNIYDVTNDISAISQMQQNLQTGTISTVQSHRTPVPSPL